MAIELKKIQTEDAKKALLGVQALTEEAAKAIKEAINNALLIEAQLNEMRQRVKIGLGTLGFFKGGIPNNVFDHSLKDVYQHNNNLKNNKNRRAEQEVVGPETPRKRM